MLKIFMALVLFTVTSLGFAQSSGLKKVNYQDETSDKKSDPAPGASLSPEESQKLTENIEIIKLRQAEAQKALDEMDQDEE